ncbi:MAG: methyltransferase domain-containing protein [Lentisphaerae bacterium]|nr:methyltransferase domain-containing protein [Lentisphaerota bacterium]
MSNTCQADKHQEVSEYYGSTLQKSEDLKTNACCTIQAYPEYIRKPLGMIHDEVTSKYYGCGLTIPHELSGCRLLDLGSGSGRDCYLASYLVGAEGNVVGVDMTDEQLAVANRHIGYHMEQFGYDRPNVEFRNGLIEKLSELGLEADSFDVVISNCVINLCPDKVSALREIYRVLKPGGEFYFSDVYADQTVPQHLVEDPVLYGECLSGALAEQDFMALAVAAGFNPPREVERSPITIENEAVQALVGDIRFDSITYRLFKLPASTKGEGAQGGSVTYKGTLETTPDCFELDLEHRFAVGAAVAVSEAVRLILANSRFARHFEFIEAASC